MDDIHSVPPLLSSFAVSARQFCMLVVISCTFLQTLLDGPAHDAHLDMYLIDVLIYASRVSP